MTLQRITDPWGWAQWAFAYGLTMLFMAGVSTAVASVWRDGSAPFAGFGVLIFCLSWAMCWTTLYLVLVGMADLAIAYFRLPVRIRLALRVVAAAAMVIIAWFEPIYPAYISAIVTAIFMTAKVTIQTWREASA